MEKISGIYCIENLVNGKKYIGQSCHVYRRWVEHRGKLRRNEYKNYPIQNAWNKYGEENFIFYLVEECKQEDCDNREIFYIREMHSHIDSDGYNIGLGGEGGYMRGRFGELHHRYGVSLSEETKKKMRKPRTEEGKINIKNGMREARESGNPRKKRIKGYSRKGVPMTEENKKRNSESQMGELGNKSKLTNGQVLEIRAMLFDGAKIKPLARKYGVDPKTIRSIRDRKSWRNI
jgi:group I intron endonuclease